METYLHSNRRLRFYAFKGADIPHLRLGDLRPAVPLSSRHRSVLNLISNVRFRRLPLQVIEIDTAQMTFAAIVGRVHAGTGSRTVPQLAEIWHNSPNVSVHFDRAGISIRGAAERPRKAVLAEVGQYYFSDKFGKFPIRSFARKRIAMSAEPHIMRPTPAARFGRLAAALNRAYPESSHAERSYRFLGQSAPRCSSTRRVRVS